MEEELVISDKMGIDLSLVPIEELVAAIMNRCGSMVLAVEMSDDGDMSRTMSWSSGKWAMQLGLAEIVKRFVHHKLELSEREQSQEVD